MSTLLLFALALATPAPDDRIVVDGVPFGPQQELTCTWFTNFENSRIEQCQAAGKPVLPSSDGASIKCSRAICEQLDADARQAADWRKPEPPWGVFTVTLVGRVSPALHAKRYLGDGTGTVLIEKILSVRKSG